MKLTNEFDVPVPADAAWPLLLDVERMVPCMPGAELIERVDADTFKGRVSVRLGPVALAFEGLAKFTDIDHEARRAVVEARGADKKGRGGANAAVAFSLHPSAADAGVSKVLIETNLQLSGSIAQYGRASGLLEEVTRELVGRFAANLAQQVRDTVPQNARAAESPAALDSAAGERQPSVSTAIGGVSLAGRVLWILIVRLVRRLLGRS